MSDLEKMLDKEQVNSNKSLLGRLYDLGSKYVGYKLGLIAGGFMGAIVFGINYYESHELLGSSIAALKQTGYTFLFGGAIMKYCGYLATNISNKTKALIASVLIPSATSILLTYGIHSLKGTPEPEKSTLPTVILAIPATAVYGYKRRRQLDQGVVKFI